MNTSNLVEFGRHFVLNQRKTGVISPQQVQSDSFEVIGFRTAEPKRGGVGVWGVHENIALPSCC